MMTPEEQAIEMEYRKSERLGILCEDRQPTLSQLVIAEIEANEWQERYLKEHST